MSNDISGELNDFFGPEDQQKLVGHLAEAGWLEGTNIVRSNSDWSLHFSEKGISKMQPLSALLKFIVPQVFGLSPKAATSNDLLNFQVGAFTIAPEIGGWKLTARESQALVGLIAGYGLKNPGAGVAPDSSNRGSKRF